ncbi:MAG: poly-gamma-glutamate hydrolase family protein [Steroidobacteraceae bacterium]
MPEPDRYLSFADLQSREHPRHYRIEVLDRGSQVVLAAPHGGRIEPGTSEVALAIAADVWSCYRFEGHKARMNRHLHITSTNFDEPVALSLFAQAQLVVTVHGVRDPQPVVFLGGRHHVARTTLGAALERHDYRVAVHPNYRGEHPRNVCNHGRAGAGVQLELSDGLRRRFFHDLTPSGRARPRSALHHFAAVVRETLLTLA